MIRAVVFDFDGTLVLSNEIKRDGFFFVADRFRGGTQTMAAILADPPGDRFAICSAFAVVHGADAADLAECYSSWCEERIIVCPERPGAASMLARLQQCALGLYVNSATPEIFLRRVVSRRYPPGTFRDILGGHGAKVANLSLILAHEDIDPQEMLMVGDGIDDRDASIEIGCAFAGVAGGTLAAAVPGQMLINDLGEIDVLLERTCQ
jgi:phosphoglycolate phosphatase